MSAKGRNSTLVCILAACLGCPALLPAQTAPLRLSLDVDARVMGAGYGDDQIISLGDFSAGLLFDLQTAGLPSRAQLDALFVDGASIVFSSDLDFAVGGTVYADEDLVAYNAGTATLSRYFDGSAQGIPARADLDAAGLESAGGATNLLFSLDVTCLLPGAGPVDDEDIVRFDGTGLSKAYDGESDLDIPARADLDALQFSAATNRLYFSLDVPARIGLPHGTGKDLWVYDAGSGAGQLTTMWQIDERADMVALDEATDSDGDWLSDFEELTGLDEPGTVHPTSLAPLGPNGHITDPNDADSDDDGYSDGEEAAAGTDPNDANDWPGHVPPTVVTWAVTGIARTEAMGGGEVTSEGSHAVTARGVCWSTNPAPTLAHSVGSGGSGPGAFPVPIVGLSPNSSYYVRAWASNALGVVYGNEESFRTLTVDEAPGIRLTSDVETAILGTAYRDEEIVSLGDYAAGRLLDAAAVGLPPRCEIDAVFVMGASIVFSADQDFIVGSTIYADEDLAAYDVNAGTLSLYFDGSAHGVPAGADLNAACLETTETGTNLLFSLDVSCVLPGAGAVDDEDVVRFDGLVLSKAYDGVSQLGASARADLDGLSFRSSRGQLLFSLDVTARIGAAEGLDQHVWVYDVAGGTTALLLQSAYLEERMDLASLDQIIDSDGDWLSDFEELTGLDEPGTVHPTSLAPLGPNGHITDPNDADSDDDGYSDGEEAAAGTDPNDAGEHPGWVLPTVTTLPVHDVTAVGALGGGNVTSEGSHPVGARGVCWALTPGPTRADASAASGTGAGPFDNVAITGLNPGTSYYVRAWASNEVGVAYGNQEVFQTTIHSVPFAIRVAQDVAAPVAGTEFGDGAVLSVGPAGASTLLDAAAAGLPARAEVDAAFVLGASIVFSSDQDFMAGGTLYADEDLAAYDVNAGTLSLYFDGSAHGIPAAADLDAACLQVAGGVTGLLFSLDISCTLPGAGAVADEDVLRFANGTVSVALRGASAGIPERADVDAVLARGTNTLLFSLDVSARLGGHQADDEDLFVYDLLVGQISGAVTCDFLADRVDLTSVDEALDSDGDWLSDFEELTGLDEAATVHPTAQTPLGPNGHITLPGNADSDGDGYTDGEEAAAGTDPNDPGDPGGPRPRPSGTMHRFARTSPRRSISTQPAAVRPAARMSRACPATPLTASSGALRTRGEGTAGGRDPPVRAGLRELLAASLAARNPH